jgi:SAM-dependent methyltransferase
MAAWYQDWFGDEYLELYAHRDSGEAERHVEFVARALAGSRPNAVLDLASGGGRHTAALRKKGYRALGIDLSLSLLLQRQQLPLVRGDMRALPFTSGSFDWVLNFFTSFGYFEAERENFQVLEEVNRVLAPGGYFVIDLMNPQRTLRELTPSETTQIGGRRVEIERWYDGETRRVNKRIRLLDGGPPRTYLESVRVYSRDEVTIGMRWVGLEVIAHYGSFALDRYDADSERLILVARRPA